MSSTSKSSRKRKTRQRSPSDPVPPPPKKKDAPARRTRSQVARKDSLFEGAAEKTLEERKVANVSIPDALPAAAVPPTEIIEALQAQLQATKEKAARAAKENADLLQMVKKGAQCPVCHEVKAVRFVAGCGHHLCPSCVCGIVERELQSHERAGSCPLCRRAITKLTPAHYILEQIVNTAVGGSLCRNEDWSQRFVECAKKMLDQGRNKGCYLLLRTCADRGNSRANPDAQNMLGEIHAKGLCGYYKNLDRARKWFARAAAQKNALGEYWLGALYYYSEQFGRAFEYFSRSATKGNSLGQFALGECYYRGRGTDLDYKEAFKWFSKSSELRAKKRLGDCYNEGHGIEQDFYESYQAYWSCGSSHDSESEYGPSYYGLGMLYFEGRMLSKKRMYSLAVFNFKKTLETMDHGCREPLIEHDIVHPRLMAAYMLGICYRRGLGVEQNTSTSRKYFLISANGGLSKGMFELAKSYMEEKKYDEAVAHLKSAAEKNHTEAMNCLGYCYSRALGVTQDLNGAAQWYKYSAEKKSATAMFNLALCYAQGKGVEMNCETARRYFKEAADLNHKAAQSALDAWARLEEQCF